MNENPFASAFENEGQHNQPVYSVSELSGALKRTVEDAFALVRVRGEISGFKRAASGHMYLGLKDENAVMDAVCWKGVAARMDLKPQDGMEVVCKGRLTTYPGRSKYQLVIDSMELAGEGALLKLLEDLKKKLAAEGLFDPERKKPIPFLPQKIGIVTSPTGAVIRDIMHRLNDRFPRPVLLWPCLVQGKGAPEQIARAIDGFNEMVDGPDLIIVARGGGSLEDLWSFNEEIVVRAAARSKIALISAVGHETDTTLIDYAADRRAPTPTAAAEMAVPVARELKAQVMEDEARLFSSMNRLLDERQIRVQSAARALPNPARLVEEMTQRLDDRAERLENALTQYWSRHQSQLENLGARLPAPTFQISRATDRLGSVAHSLERAYHGKLDKAQAQFERQSTLLRKSLLDQKLERLSQDLSRHAALMESYSYKGVLERGFVLVSDVEDKPVLSPEHVKPGDGLTLQFAGDEKLSVIAQGRDFQPKPKPKPKSRKSPPKPASDQGSLF